MAQVCPHCQKRFPFPSNLRRHVSAVHLKERPFACAECHKSFATQRNLELHVRIRHRDERPHQCHVCSYRCHLPADLRKHLESHARGRRLGWRREDLVAAWLEEAGLAFERTVRVDFCDGEEPELARLDFVLYTSSGAPACSRSTSTSMSSAARSGSAGGWTGCGATTWSR